MSLTCSTIFAATLVISSSIQAMLTLNKTLFCTGLLLTQSNPSKWNSVKGSFIWICLQLKTMQSLSETPTWVMNWQLFLNNPNIDKWKRLRVKKSKLFTEQRHDKYILAGWHKSFLHCGKNPSLGRSEIQTQWADAANICFCYQKYISLWLLQRIWDKRAKHNK